MLARRGMLGALFTPLILRAPEFGKIIMAPRQIVPLNFLIQGSRNWSWSLNDLNQIDILADIEELAKQLNRNGVLGPYTLIR